MVRRRWSSLPRRTALGVWPVQILVAPAVVFWVVFARAASALAMSTRLQARGARMQRIAREHGHRFDWTPRAVDRWPGHVVLHVGRDGRALNVIEGERRGR